MLREVTEMGNFLSAGLLFAGAKVDPAVRMTARFLTEEREEPPRGNKMNTGVFYRPAAAVDGPGARP
jgi:hypothetical protein